MTLLPHSTQSGSTETRSWRYLVIVVSILVSVAILEIFGRLMGIGLRRDDVNVNWSETGWAKENPLVGWVNRAGTFHSVEGNEGVMTFWPDGRRVSWHDARKPASKEVHFYGGSFTQGYSVSDEETFVFRLNAMVPDVRFVNLGVGGYGGYQALLLMRQIEQDSDLDPKPDLIVYGFNGDHLRRNVATSDWINGLKTSKHGFLVPPHARIDGEVLHEFSPDFISYWPMETRSVLLTLLHNAILALKFDDWSGSSEEVNIRLITMMRDLADANGSQFLVVFLDNVPEELPGRLEGAEISFVDCVNPALDQDPRLRVNHGTGHPSGAQHELWSRCIGRWVADAGFNATDRQP